MLRSQDARRLLTVPGVNLIAAGTFLAAIGDITRFRNARALVADLGLDPKVRQSGEEPARSGRISKRGSASARWALVEATWSVVNQPGPLRAFYQRVRARRGHGKAIVAAARKLAMLFWCLLSRGEDYAHQQPSLTAQKLRRLELAAGASVLKGRPTGVGSPTTRCAPPNANSPNSPTSERSATGKPRHPRKWARARHRGTHIRPSKGKAARQTTSP
jgi:transposase